MKSTFIAILLLITMPQLVRAQDAKTAPKTDSQPAQQPATPDAGQNVAITQPPLQTAPPPQRSQYLQIAPAPQKVNNVLLLPAAFWQNQLGISVDTLSAKSWRLSWFGRSAQMKLGASSADTDSGTLAMGASPTISNGQPYFPWNALAKSWGLQWQQYKSADGTPVLFVQYQAAYLEDMRYSTSPKKFRVVYELSNPTVVRAQDDADGPQFMLSAARRGGAAALPTYKNPGDLLIDQLVTQSGNWAATLKVLLRYQAPVNWFTLGNPPRLVVDVQRNFEKSYTKKVAPGLTYEHIRRGLWRGPQLLYVVRANPQKGWRLSVAGAGYSVLKRDVVSRVGQKHHAAVAVNGGYFAYDGAAVGAVKIQGEWLRLPWPQRSVMGLAKDGSVKIGQIHLTATAKFGTGKKYPLANFNGFPKPGHISAITRHLTTSYTLKPGEMALVIENNVVTHRPGGGVVAVPKTGFVLVASGAARPYLEAIKRGTAARLDFNAPAWKKYPTILGGGPQLMKNGQVHVRSEHFRPDVLAAGPRTAVGVDQKGNYLVVVADGRRPTRSVGLTLNEMGATMLKLDAVKALNFDGGGSTAMAINGKLVNHPSDGHQRRVSNVVMIVKPK